MFLNGDKEDGIMHAKTMEGLIGARTNIELLNTPFRVYKEARLKGDTAKMEQAMGYMRDCYEAAYEFKEEADEGMKEDAEENRKIAEEQREEVIRKHREEREKLEERIEENRNTRADTDSVEISEEGKELLEENTDWDNVDLNSTVSAGTKIDTDYFDMVKKHVTYTKSGEVNQTRQSVSISISV